MLKDDCAELDYYQLVKKAKRLESGRGQKVKVALLGDVSTQHLVPLLRVLFASNGYDAEIFEAGFDTIELEAYNPQSDLYAFQPQLVVLVQSVAKLKYRYYDYSGERAAFATEQADKMEKIWLAIQSQIQVPIIQSNFAIPYERPFGNFSQKVAGSLQGSILALNRELYARAAQHASVFINDIENIASWVGRSRFFDEKLYALAKGLCALEFLPLVAQNVVDISLATLGRAVKCVVLDLDNTLWGGVVGDDGLEGIGLGDLDEGGAFRSLQLFMRELWSRGIILAVCSKNNEEIARKVFTDHPDMVLRENHIAVFVANWEDKASNIARIREKLNIGYDSMVFLDDNPFERNLVRKLIPQIIVPELPEDPALYVRAIAELNLFEATSQSALDSQRTAMYQEQDKRDAEAGRFANLQEYLQSLDTTAVFGRFEPRNLGRIAQLIQRSNQFNLTTRRYSEAQCEEFMRADGYFPFSITVSDRFGDFGLINVVVLKHGDEELEIDAFLMSCRVLKRGVEQYAMNKIFEYAQQRGLKRVTGRYIPTAKNMMVQNFYEEFGFRRQDDDGGEGVLWALDVASYQPATVFIRENATAA